MWHLVPQEEKQGKMSRTVLVRRLRGGKARKNVNGTMVETVFSIKDRMFKALVDSDGPSAYFMLPREIIFSQKWVSKTDGTMYVAGIKEVVDPKTGKTVTVRTEPNPKYYFQRHKVNVKVVQRRYYKEIRTGKRCTTKVTQRLEIDEWTDGGQMDEDGEWWIKHEVSARPFELNNANGDNQWASMLLYLEDQFGIEVATAFGIELYERLKED